MDSMTEAAAVQAPQDGPAAQLATLIEAGGPVVIILIAMSVIGLTIVLLKLWQFRSAGVGADVPVADAVRLHHQGRGREALSLLEGRRGPLAEVTSLAIAARLRNLPEALGREEALRHGADRLEDLRGHLRPLEVIASLAPLLGLFGTVLGMISAFQALEAAGSQVDPAVLSGGIWEALLTTAVGLAVAMPAIVFLNWLERRLDRLAHDMDSAVSRVFTLGLAAGIDQGEREHARLRPAAVVAAGE